MSCFNPIRIRSKAIGSTPKDYMYVPCGRCVGCLKDKQHKWIYRLEREQVKWRTSLFVTLTYDVENVPLKLDDDTIIRYKEYVQCKSIKDCVMTLLPDDVTKFFKRLRRKGLSFRYFYSGEYGDQFNRPHYHIAFFFDDCADVFYYYCSREWYYGDVQNDPLCDGTIRYITKYMLKGHAEAPPDERCYPCFSRNSQGIGVDGFMDDYNYYNKTYKPDNEQFIKSVTLNNGQLIPVPRYFRQTVLRDEVPPYTIDVEQVNIDERNKLNKKKFFIWYAKVKIKMGFKSPSEALRYYNRLTDPERLAQVADTQRRRRKGL